MNKILLTKLIFVLAFAPNLMGSSSSPSANPELKNVTKRKADEITEAHNDSSGLSDISSDDSNGSVTDSSSEAEDQSSSSKRKAKKAAGSYDPLLRNRAFGNPSMAHAYYQKVISEGTDIWSIPLAQYQLGKLLIEGAGTIAAEPEVGKALLQKVANQTINADVQIRARQLLATMSPPTIMSPVSSSSSSSSSPSPSSVLKNEKYKRPAGSRIDPNLRKGIVTLSFKKGAQKARGFLEKVISEGYDTWGIPLAQYHLGKLLVDGADNVIAEPETGKALLLKAANQTINEPAQMRARQLLAELETRGADRPIPMRNLAAASSSSSSSSSPSLSSLRKNEIYARPAGTVIDPNLKSGALSLNVRRHAKARFYFEKVISAGSDTWGIPLAQFHLGKLLIDGGDTFVAEPENGKGLLLKAANQAINEPARNRAKNLLAEIAKSGEAPVPSPAPIVAPSMRRPASIIAPSIHLPALSAPTVPMVQLAQPVSIQRSMLPAPVYLPVAQDDWHRPQLAQMSEEQQRNIMLFMAAHRTYMQNKQREI